MGSSWSRIARRIRVPLGFAFAALYLWLARPTIVFMILSLVLVVPGIWLRAYASGYVKKNTELTVTGPYAFTRNPLYLGSMLIAFGFALASRSTWIAAVLSLLFIVIYVPVIRSEEAFLHSKFAEFDSYAEQVPRLLPRLTPAHIGNGERGSFSVELYQKHREYNALMGAVAIYAALALRIYLWS